jgi:glycerophosphoryl diester phosphodiesterase
MKHHLLIMLAALSCSVDVAAKSHVTAPILIAHRGASGDRPEHTIAAYALAIEQGADFIEPDLVLTKDGVLVARHENEISETTDIGARPEFAGRKATKIIDGQSYTGWFTEDLTLAELKTLRAKERLPQLRPANMAYDGKFEVPTFDEVLALAADASKRTGRTIGIYPETKHPSYFRSIGLDHETPLLAGLDRFGHRDASSPVFIQSFEVANLKALAKRTKVRLVQLMDMEGGPADDLTQTYAQMSTAKGLRSVARYAQGVGPNKAYIIPRNAKGSLGKPTNFVANAHAAGLKVHPWTFRAENFFLPNGLKRGDDPRTKGDLGTELKAFLATGIDGYFSDNVAEAKAALD